MRFPKGSDAKYVSEAAHTSTHARYKLQTEARCACTFRIWHSTLNPHRMSHEAVRSNENNTYSQNIAAIDPSREPSTISGPVRRFKDPEYLARAASLAEIRQGIDELDDKIVPLLAKRALLVKDATRFKRDRYQVAAPARQEAVFKHVRSEDIPP